jgi:cytochrome c oxidase subunit 2
MRSNNRHIAIVIPLIAVGAVLTWIVLRAVYTLAPPASAEAGPIDQLFEGHFIVIAFLFALVVGLMLYSVFAFRRRPGDEEEGVYFHGNTVLEITWTLVPLGLVLAFGVWAATILNDITSPKDGEMPVRVIGQQWSWAFEYPELDNLLTTELVVPVNRTIRLEMEARDVLHAFWVPEFRVKKDLVPGQVTVLRVTPNVEGEYRLRCAEICGLEHSTMVTPVRVLSAAEFESWADEQMAAAADVGVLLEMTPEERGAQWASPTEFACAACHTTTGAGSAGPTWLDLFGRQEELASGETVLVDEPYLETSILHPGEQIVAGFPDVMPKDFEQRFAEREAELAEREVEVDILADLIAYIISLEE